jgi:hypothetical protein
MFAIVVLQMTLLAAPDASFSDQGSRSSGRCAAFAEPPPPARIEGVVDAVREGLETAKEPPTARLELRSRDIVRVSWTDDGAAVLFDENGRKAIEEFTAANLNRPGMVTIDGMPTSPRAPVIYGIVDSGAVRVSEDALRGPLCETLEAAPQAR